jgi:hypothetical protein
MKKLFYTIAAPAIFLSLLSCKSADSNIGKISADFCNCFKAMEAKLSDDTKKLVNDAANTATPDKSMQEALTGLDPEKAQKVGTELISFGEIGDKNSETGLCLEGVKKKYKGSYTSDEKKFLEKIIKELEVKPDCNLTANLLKMGLKAKD